MISNATPLICLAKINRLDILQKLFTKVFVPQEVKDEILLDDKQGYFVLLEAFDSGWFEVQNPKKQFTLHLGKGETAAIALAKERKDSIILDDAAAMKAAEALNISTIRTTTVLFLAVEKRIIKKEEALILLNKLIEDGYYIAPQYYTKILMKLKTK